MGKAYTEKQNAKFKERIIDGLIEGKSILSLLKEKGMCSRVHVYKFFHYNDGKNPLYDEEFVNNYARAREDSGDHDAERIGEIVQMVIDGDLEPNAARAAMDGLKWIAARKKPKVYGDKLDLSTAGKPLESVIHHYHIPDNGRDSGEEEEDMDYRPDGE